MSKSIELNPDEVKKQYPIIYEIFLNKTTVGRENESLHDKFIRLKLKCYCQICRQTKLL